MTSKILILATFFSFNAFAADFALRNSGDAQIGLPQTVEIRSLTISQSDRFRAPNAEITYLSSAKTETTILVPLTKIGQIASHAVVRAVVQAEGELGGSCGPHDMKILTLEFEMDAALQFSSLNLIGTHETTVDNCHSPMQIETIAYDLVR
ncbi:MAG: hypothetical protein ABIR96_11320 [Bdellovibrionota bacterium]